MGRGQGEGRVSCFGSWSVGRTAWSRWLSREPSWLQPKQVDRTEASLRSVLCDHRVSAVPPAHSSHCQRSYAPRPALGCPSLPPPQVAKSNLFPSNAPLKPQRRDGRREGTIRFAVGGFGSDYPNAVCWWRTGKPRFPLPPPTGRIMAAVALGNSWGDRWWRGDRSAVAGSWSRSRSGGWTRSRMKDSLPSRWCSRDRSGR